MICPMEQYIDITNQEVERFCKYGCSVICSELLQEYLEKRDKKRKLECVQLELR